MNRKNLKSLAICAAALAIVCCASFITFAASAPQGSGYHLVKKVAIGGDTPWDYLYAEPTTHRIFISHGTHTVVVDPQGTVLGDIPDTKGVHGIATATEFNRGFTSNGQANSVTVFDLTTLKTINEIKIQGQNPDAILYDPASKRVFTFNGRSSDSTAIDAKTGDIAGTITLTGKPETAQADGEGHVFVNIEDKNQIIEFDSKKLSVMNTWSIAPCESPSGLAFDVAHKRLFAGCDGKITVVVDATSGKVVATIPIGDGVDANGFDPATGFVFASCGDGTLTVAHEDSPDKYTLVETIHTAPRARTMTVDTSNHNVYTVTAEYGQPTPPPAGSPAGTRGGRAPMVPGSFTLLIYGR